MDPLTWSLAALAVAFIVLTGANDGSSIVSLSLRLPVAPAVFALTGTVVLLPALFGPRVAMALEAAAGTRTGALVAFGSATVVVLLLARHGLPTSLTLALLGALTGTGAAYGTTIPWRLLGMGVLLGVAAPVTGALLAWLAMRSVIRFATPRGMRAWGAQLAFAATCVAYAANDGQKALAIAGLALAGTAGDRASIATPWLPVLVGALFALGAVLGMRRNAARHVVAARQEHVMTAGACSAVAVLGAGWAGAPISMTQSMTGAVIGSAAADSRGRVRWGLAARLAGAWLVTMPAAVLLSAAVGAAARAATG